jgi:hypothetical protein
VDAARGLDGRPVLPAVSEADCEELLRRATIATAEQQRGDAADLDWIGEGLALVGR